MISMNVVWAIHLSWERAGIRRDHQILANLACLVAMTAPLAFWPPALLRAFGAPIDATHCFRMWGFVWLAMITFGAIILALYRTLGAAGGAGAQGLFMLLNFIIGPGLAPLELLYPPFVLGDALPLQSAMLGARTILFGSYDVLARSIGILCGWAALSLLVLAWHARAQRRKLHAAAAAAAASPSSKEGHVPAAAEEAGAAGAAAASAGPKEGQVSTAAAATAPSTPVAEEPQPVPAPAALVVAAS